METKMKRILWAFAVFFVVTAVVHAQQRTSAEIRQDAQTLSGQGRTSHTQFEATQANLNARNTSNTDAATLFRLRSEIERLERIINREQTTIGNTLDSGHLVSAEVLGRTQRFIEQHTVALAELDAFIALTQTR